jgi:DNA-binding NtrC family response regulator
MARILVVDDEPVVLELITLALQLQGHDVTAVGDPLSAFDPTCVSPANIDLLVTDVNMKPITGFEVVSRLVELGFQGQVLFMSGYSALSVANSGKPGKSAIIEKPFTVETLREAVGKALAGNTSDTAHNPRCRSHGSV